MRLILKIASMKKRKKSLTLIEVVIALSIITIVLGTLLKLYSNLSKNEAKINKQVEAVLQKHIFASQMHHIFSHIEAGEEAFCTSENPYSSQSAEFILTWDNGVQLNPELSGVIKAKIYQKDNTVFLEYFNKELEEEKRALLTDVKKMQLLFFDSEIGEWVEFWEGEKEFLPAMVKIELFPLDGSKAWGVAFFMHENGHIITYEK